MKARWWILGFAVWTVVAVLAGRFTVPDRTEELVAWRKAADSTLQAVTARADSARVRDSLRLAQVSEDAAAGHRELVRVERQAANRIEEVDSLRGELARVEGLADTAAMVGLQRVIISRQEGTIDSLRAGVRLGAAALAKLRDTLAVVRREKAKSDQDLRDLQATVAAGLEATKPSRGRALGFLDCTIGVGATSQGLDYRSATCGVSVRGLIGGK